MPQILINREPLRHLNFDVELLGDCDVIVNELCHRLGPAWESICTLSGPSQEISRSDIVTPPASRRPSPMFITNSEESSRMSFQVSPDESSQMSTNQNPEETTEPTNNKELLEPNQGMIPNDSTASLCSLVGHLTTSQSAEPTGSPSSSKDTNSPQEADSSMQKSLTESTDTTPGQNQANSEATEKSQTSAEPKTSEETKTDEKTQEEINDLEDLRACWEPRIFNLAARLKGSVLFCSHP